MADRILRAESLKKSYRRVNVVEDVSLRVKSGEVVGLLGPNGAGKTTCFYMIAGLLAPDAGRLWLDDADITGLPMHRRVRLGISYLPQEPSIFRMSVWDNMMAALEMNKKTGRQERIRRGQALLAELNLTALSQNRAELLSGGERRRLEIARTLALEPDFLLLDEPFAGVDPVAVGEIKKIIRALADKNIGIVLTDHNVRESLDICRHVLIINDGHILAEGAAEQVVQDLRVREVYLGEGF